MIHPSEAEANMNSGTSFNAAYYLDAYPGLSAATRKHLPAYIALVSSKAGYLLVRLGWRLKISWLAFRDPVGICYALEARDISDTVVNTEIERRSAADELPVYIEDDGYVTDEAVRAVLRADWDRMVRARVKHDLVMRRLLTAHPKLILPAVRTGRVEDLDLMDILRDQLRKTGRLVLSHPDGQGQTHLYFGGSMHGKSVVARIFNPVDALRKDPVGWLQMLQNTVSFELDPDRLALARRTADRVAAGDDQATLADLVQAWRGHAELAEFADTVAMSFRLDIPTRH